MALAAAMALLTFGTSPLLCCCALRALLDAAVPMSAPAGEVVLVPGAAEMPAACPHCCAVAADSATPAEPAPDHRPCHCHDQDRDGLMAKSDTLPGAAEVPCVLPPSIEGTCIGDALAREERPRISTAPSPPSTPLRLHVLLLT